MNYTKGKWKVNIPMATIATYDTIIAKVIVTKGNVNEMKANANLIAASPRMIEFIQNLARQGNKEASDFIQTLDLS